MKHLSVFLCLKYLRKKKIVLLSVAAVSMSTALLIVIANLFTGFIDVIENSSSLQMGDIVLNAPSSMKIPQYDKFIEELEGHPSIHAATSVLSSQGLLLLDKGNVRAVKIWGIQVPHRGLVTPFKDTLVRQKDLDSQPSFALDGTSEMAGFLGIGLVSKPDEETDEYDFNRVDRIISKKVYLTTGSDLGKKTRTIKFVVTDAVYSGIHDFDNAFVYLPIDQLSQKLYPDMPPVCDTIQIKTAPGIDPDLAIDSVRVVWEQFASGQLGWNSFAIASTDISTSRSLQYQLVAEYKKQMGMLLLVFGVISGGIILLVCCIFYLIVMTRQKDIAVVKSCGLGSGSVWVLFLFFGMLAGVAGAVIGTVIGFVVTIHVNTIERWVSSALGLKLWKSSTYMFSRIPNVMNWDYAFWIVIFAVAAAVIGALIPAIVAAKIRPVKILRYE